MESAQDAIKLHNLPSMYNMSPEEVDATLSQTLAEKLQLEDYLVDSLSVLTAPSKQGGTDAEYFNPWTTSSSSTVKDGDPQGSFYFESWNAESPPRASSLPANGNPYKVTGYSTPEDWVDTSTSPSHKKKKDYTATSSYRQKPASDYPYNFHPFSSSSFSSAPIPSSDYPDSLFFSYKGLHSFFGDAVNFYRCSLLEVIPTPKWEPLPEPQEKYWPILQIHRMMDYQITLALDPSASEVIGFYTPSPKKNGSSLLYEGAARQYREYLEKGGSYTHLQAYIGEGWKAPAYTFSSFTDPKLGVGVVVRHNHVVSGPFTFFNIQYKEGVVK